MNSKDLIKLHTEMSERSRATMAKKNHDYTSASDDPFANFRASTMIGIHPVKGIMMRCMDKFKRIQTFVERGELQVDGESVLDACEDFMNYSVLMYGIIKEIQDGESDMNGVRMGKEEPRKEVKIWEPMVK